MIKKLNFKTFLTFLLLGVFMGTFSCKEDTLEVEDEALISNEASSTSRRVNATDIPEIMQFVNEQTNGRLTYQLKGVPGTREPDLTVGQVQTANILQVTNPYNLSNYTFAMTKTEPDGELSFLNLVVKETATGVYSYIMKIRPDVNWFNNQTGTEMNMLDYTGDIVLYTAEGIYVHKTTFSTGQPVSYETRDPCPNEGNNPPSGGGGSQPPPTNPPPTGGGNNPPPTGGGNNPPSGGCTILILIIDCGGTNSNTPHDPLACDGPNGPNNGDPSTQTYDIVIIIDCPQNIQGDETIQNILRAPCPPNVPEECFLPNGDPCPFGCDANGDCAPDPNDPVNENNETSIFTQIETPCQKLNELVTNTNFNSALSNLQAKVINTPNGTEVGYEVSKNNGVVNFNYVNDGGYFGVILKHGGDIIGGMHYHPPGWGQSMFSADDINKLYKYTFFATNHLNNIFTLVVTDMGTFALTIKNRNLLGYIINTIGVDGLQGKLDGYYDDPTGNQGTNKFTGGLLKVFKEIKDTYNLPGDALELYELNTQGTEFKKVTLDNTNEPIKSSCN